MSLVGVNEILEGRAPVSTDKAEETDKARGMRGVRGRGGRRKVYINKQIRQKNKSESFRVMY